MEFSHVATVLEGIPLMTPAQGRRVYDHLRKANAHDVLELGTAHGVSSAYMAAAVEDVDGRVTTVDHVAATRLRNPQPDAVHQKVGLADRIDRVLVDGSSYTWWLKDKVQDQSDHDGNVTPIYDFCYVDGAHNFTIDGLAVVLVEKLLRPGGWLLLDDLRWSYGGSRSSFGPGQDPEDLRLSAAEMSEAHMQIVYDIIVRQMPSFTSFGIENDDWGWAHKDPGNSEPSRS